MQKRRRYSVAICLLSLTALLATPVFANSSWRWLSDTRPYDLLPIAIVMTLTIEILVINFLPRVNKLPKTAFWVTLSNLMSFGSTYLVTYLSSGVVKSFDEMLEYTPVYTIGLWSFLLTAAVEIPLVQWKLSKGFDEKRQCRLLVTLLCVNALTTALVFTLERTLAPGKW